MTATTDKIAELERQNEELRMKNAELLLAVQAVRYWFEAERKSISKGNGSQWSMWQCEEQMEAIDTAIANANSPTAANADALTDREIMQEWDRHYLPGQKDKTPFLSIVVKFARALLERAPAANAVPLVTPGHDGAPCAQCGDGGVHLCGQSAADAGDQDVMKLAERIAKAVADDEQDGGCDICAGLFGPNFSAIIHELAANRPPAVGAPDQKGGAE
ncbi:MAG TPA: hypothetical protein VJ654_14320 [Noviherbaspirillum sp.]|nr:hypothetical protein [Noviherbaspirillum sp.]